MIALKRPVTIFGSMVFLAAGCLHPLQQPAPLRLEDFRVLGIAPGMDATGIDEALGGSDYHIEVFKGTGRMVFWNANVEFTAFEFENEAGDTIYAEVRKVSVTGPKVKTVRGLKIGDSVSRLRQLYGQPASVGDTAWLYTGPTDSKGQFALTVVVKDGIVSGITIRLAPREL